MFPIIQIDTSEVVASMSFSNEEVKSFNSYILDRISTEYMTKWETIVDKELKSTRRAYKLGMDMKRIDNNTVVFSLEGKGESTLAIMLENGATPFEMQKYFEKSSKIKQKQGGGWYLTIPMRLATSEAIAESSVFAGQLTKPYQDLIKKHGVLTKKNVPKEMQIKGVRSEIKTPTKTYPSYEHKSFMFEGAKRMKTPFKQGYYMQFRRVSDLSDDNAWIHPGFQPRKFMDRALEEMQIDRVYEVARDEFINIYNQ
jgi:hypothetical protein